MGIRTFSTSNISGGKQRFLETQPYTEPGSNWYDYTAADLYTEVNTWTSNGSPSVTSFSVSGDVETFWTSATLAPNGKIYIAQGVTSSNITVIDTNTDSVYSIDTGGSLNVNSYYHGVPGNDGKLYFPPASKQDWLIIDPDTDDIDYQTYGQTYSSSTSFWACARSDSGVIYAGGSVDDYAILDPMANTYTTSSYGSVVNLTSAGHIGEALGADGNIYFGPYVNTNLFRINPANNTASTLGSFGSQHSQTLSGGRGNVIVAARHNSSTTGYYDTDTSTLNLPAQGTKSGSSCLGTDGNIYVMPWFTNVVEKIDPINRTITTFGSLTSARYFGSILATNGYIYTMGENDNKIYKIDTNGTGKNSSMLEAVALSSITNGGR